MASGIIMTGMILLAMLALTLFNDSANPDVATGVGGEQGDATAGAQQLAA